MAQEYSAYDPRAHLTWLAPAFADPRYVRVHDRPLFLIYDAGSIPDLARVVEGWREAAVSLGIADPYLCGVLSPGGLLEYEAFLQAGFDAVTEFFPTGRRPLRGRLNSGAGQRAVNVYRSVRPTVERVLPRRARPIIHD